MGRRSSRSKGVTRGARPAKKIGSGAVVHDACMRKLILPHHTSHNIEVASVPSLLPGRESHTSISAVSSLDCVGGAELRASFDFPESSLILFQQRTQAGGEFSKEEVI